MKAKTKEKDFRLDYKLDYMSKLFNKTSRKKIENYALTRLWHRIDNEDIKMVPQQRVGRKDKYALTDVYFPQFGIFVEVNEPPHYRHGRKIQADKKRNTNVEKQTGGKLYEIDCTNKLEDIHRRIDEIVKIINVIFETQKKDGAFKPWHPNDEHDPYFWLKNNFITTKDNVCMNNIEDICKLFGADFNKIKRGFLRRGALVHPDDKNIKLWWPSEKSRQGWQNIFNKKDYTITETHSDPLKNKKLQFIDTTQTRYVFYLDQDILGLKGYKFKGVFKYDKKKSKMKKAIVWTKVADKITLNPNKYE